MNKQREALEEALEILGSAYVPTDDYSQRVIALIEEALAEQEQEQEPIAVVTSQTGDPSMTMSWHHEPALPIGTKLYTAPPVRKPLTDTEIDALFNSQAWVSVVFFDAYGKPLERASSRDFARAIERAHGIGGEE